MSKLLFWIRSYLLPLVALLLVAVVLVLSAIAEHKEPSFTAETATNASLAGFIPLALSDEGAELRALDMLDAAGFTGLLSPTRTQIPLSNYVSADMHSLDELRTLPVDDPRYTPWIAELSSLFYQGDRRLIFLPFQGPRSETLNKLALLALANASEDGSLPWAMEATAPWPWYTFFCAGIAVLVLVLLVVGHRRSLPALVLGLLFITGGLVLASRIFAWESVLVFGIILAKLLLRISELAANDLGHPFWYRFRHLSSTLLRSFHIRRVLRALPLGLRVQLITTAVSGLLLLVLLPAGGWSLALLAVLMLAAPLFLQTSFAVDIGSKRNLSHRPFSFVRMQTAPAGRQSFFLLFAILSLIGLAVPVCVQLSRQLPGSSPLFGLEGGASLSAELGKRHAFFQAWFGYGAQWEDVGPGAEVRIPRFERQGGGYSYWEQLLASYDEWAGRLLPASQDPLRLAFEQRAGSLAPPIETGVYSGAGGRTGNLILFLVLVAAAAIPPGMELIRMRIRSLPRFALSIRKAPVAKSNSKVRAS